MHKNHPLKQKLLLGLATLPIAGLGAANAQILDLDTQEETSLEIDESLGVDLKTGDEIDVALADEATIISDTNTQIYNEADENNDNYLSEDEFQTYVSLRADTNTYLNVREEGDYDFWYDSADIDRDGVLNVEEFRRSRDIMVEADGAVSNYQEQEDASILAAETEDEALFRGEAIDVGSTSEFDTSTYLPGDSDRDGYYSRAEFRNYVDAMAGQDVSVFASMRANESYGAYYARADRNNDGLVTMAEIEAETHEITEESFEDAEID